MSKRILNFLMLVSVGAFLCSAGWIVLRLAEYRTGEDNYQKLMDFVDYAAYTLPEKTEKDDTSPSGARSAQTDAATAASQAAIGWPDINFAALRAINSEVVGWIVCENTKINYPVVQGKDNSYYLSHHFNGRRSIVGCVFLDCRNSPHFTDTNSILYGHQVSDGSMFSAVLNYKKQAYYDAHPRMLLLTPEANYLIDLFAGYVAKADEPAWRLDFSTPGEYLAWLEAACRRSTFRSTVKPTEHDRVITLSTCTYEFYNARYVLLGVLRQSPK